jgi:hypothetical protein
MSNYNSMEKKIIKLKKEIEKLRTANKNFEKQSTLDYEKKSCK